MSRIRILLICGILLLLGSVCAPVTAAWPASVYAPYVDVSLNPHYFIHLPEMRDACGVNYSTLCFVNADEDNGNEPAWGAKGNMIPITEQSLYGEAKAIRALGGDIIISFGGADAGALGNNYTLAQKWTDVTQLQSKYQEVIDLYDATWIDFDIEQYARLDTASVDRRNKAIAGLKANPANAGLKVAYCLPCEPEDGFHPTESLPILTNAKENGAEIDYWNAMAFDYGSYYRGKFGTNMSHLAILTIEKINSQLQTTYGYSEADAYAHMGYTGMIGQTDQTPDEVFWLNSNTKDATVMRDYVMAKNIPMMAIWSANRDNAVSVRDTTPSPVYSGVPQNVYDFSKILVQIE